MQRESRRVMWKTTAENIRRGNPGNIPTLLKAAREGGETSTNVTVVMGRHPLGAAGEFNKRDLKQHTRGKGKKVGEERD